MRTLTLAPVLMLLLMASCPGPGHASLIGPTSSSSSALSSLQSENTSSGKQLSNSAANVSIHPNLVTYPQSPTRKAKLDDDMGSDMPQSPATRISPAASSSNNHISLTPVAKAALDISSDSAASQYPSAISSNNSSKPYCDRPKRTHTGLIFKPSRKTYPIGMTLVMQCHNGVIISASCEEGGFWTRGPPHCPPTNQTCPDHVFANGNVTYTGATAQVPHPLQSHATFKCHEGYELVGAPMVVCDKGFRWSYRTPVCRPVSPDQSTSSSSSLLNVLLVAIGILLFLVLVISLSLWYYWWRQKRQREYWQRYFGNFTYARQSKHKIQRPQSHNNTHHSLHQEMKQFKATASVLPSTEL